MIKPEHVPLKAIHALVMNLHKPWPDAIAAALNAWPDMEEHITWPEGKLSHIILPMEAGNEIVP